METKPEKSSTQVYIVSEQSDAMRYQSSLFVLKTTVVPSWQHPRRSIDELEAYTINYVLISSVHISAALAQLGERQTEDLKAPCSIHGGGIAFLCRDHSLSNYKVFDRRVI